MLDPVSPRGRESSWAHLRITRGNLRLTLLYGAISQRLGALLGAFAAFGDAPFLLGLLASSTHLRWCCWALQVLLGFVLAMETSCNEGSVTCLNRRVYGQQHNKALKRTVAIS